MKTLVSILLLLSCILHRHNLNSNLESSYAGICSSFRQGPGTSDLNDFYEEILDDLDELEEEAE